MNPIYLTFDDGPDPEWTPRILDLLAAAQVVATFFMIGRNAVVNRPLVRRAVAEGHEVGNHTFSHHHPLMIGARRARDEVRTGSQALADLLGRPVKYFRPPHGRVRNCMLEEAAVQGQSLVLWDVSAVDWGPLGHSRAIAHRLQNAMGGDIVLMHDGNRGINRTRELAKILPHFLSDLSPRNLNAALLP